ncbi:sulfate reduction electron transfer complex DsrMKJOP subunit DsrJ [Desulfobulbus oralis]|uniref:Cytochrome C n=1 Tax=Desulfobulbus oralis TaxID=1986146 RepID=A0A2L1GKW5_9BACT|nr:sulfate reduction electron transfer complex DsrMKJOP subunit DsrJ [Desulfobulbus oralis]AVD70286.1 cytochrome C [Desulfobulbus oralis]
MYDRVKIITGLVIFVLLVLIPFLYNGKASKAVPELSLPTTAKHCVLPADEMRAKHMQLLNTWRDEVVRSGDRTPVVVDGQAYPKSLQLNCMACHTSKVNFCDRCHDYSSVKPYCWDCHLAPVE